MFPLITGKLTFIFGDLIAAIASSSAFWLELISIKTTALCQTIHQLFANRHRADDKNVQSWIVKIGQLFPRKRRAVAGLIWHWHSG